MSFASVVPVIYMALAQTMYITVIMMVVPPPPHNTGPGSRNIHGIYMVCTWYIHGIYHIKYSSFKLAGFQMSDRDSGESAAPGDSVAGGAQAGEHALFARMFGVMKICC